MADFLGGLGRNPNNFRQPETPYEKYIVQLGNTIQRDFKEYIDSNTRGSGALGSSIKALPSKDGFEIEGDFYYKFIDEGVNAAPKQPHLKYNRSLVVNSPYSFKHTRVGSKMVDSLRSIVSGSIGDVYAVAVSIKKHGIKPHGITDGVITDGLLEQISEDLLELTGLNMEFVFDKNFKEFT